MVAETVRAARAVGATGQILVCGDSAYGNSAVIGACVKAGVRFSFVLIKNKADHGMINNSNEDHPGSASTDRG
jgi:hypothetical protein